MPLEETVQRRGLSFSPSRGLAAPVPAGRAYGVVVGQPRAARSPPYASARKPPEPLRRAVADCLSPPASHLHGSSGPNSSSSVAAEASRTLRDYIANPATVDMAYSVLVEHALAERDRSPAVVPRCIALLKRYLTKYVPRVQTLRQIELFCANSLTKCEPTPNQGETSFSNPTLVKSIIYVRSLVAKHIPKLSFQPKQPFKNPLSSLKSRSFASKLVPDIGIGRENIELKQGSNLKMLSDERTDMQDGNTYIHFDLLKWRWRLDGQHALPETKDSESAMKIQDRHVSVEVGAAALLVGEMEGRLESQNWRYPVDLLDINSLQPSQGTDFASSHSHMKAITASKRLKGGPNEVWSNIPSSTFQPRARPLFQYRHYSEQQPLKLNPTEIYEVISEVCSASSSQNKNQLNAPSRLSNHGRQLDADVAFSVLIKLIIDMYMMDPTTAAPLTLYMLEGILRSQTVASKTRAFDLILNLGVHAHLIEPMLSEENNTPIIENGESSSQSSYLKNNEEINNNNEKGQLAKSSAIENFESWLLMVLFEILLLLVQIEEREEIVWASALSCLFYFVCDRGNIIRNRLDGLDIRVIKALLEISREHSWAEAVHSKLICMLTNMLYLISPGGDSTPIFLINQIDLLGGIDYICLEYSRAGSKEEKRDLFLILFDYVVHEINESCVANGVASYTYEDIQPLVSLFTLNDFAPDAFYLMVKNGIEGIGDILRTSISHSFAHNSEFEHLNLLLEKITNKLEYTIRSFCGIDTEFLHMVQMTKNYKSVQSIKEGFQNPEIALDASLSWVTLHSLLHSATSAYRHHGYIWLVDLLLSEITSNSNLNQKEGIWDKIQRFQENIQIAGSQDNSAFLKVPLAICVLCGLLKSKSNFIRFGFLFVLERFLTRFQLFLDEREENKMGISGNFHNNNNSRGNNHNNNNNNNNSKNRLDKAVAVIDIMSSALSLVVQINETDHINILKMCDMLFSQLCLHPTKQSSQSSCQSEATSKAAQLLRGRAIAPMQLVRRVPASLFYWPLIQLAGAATDDIALGMAVGSTGRGNIPGATSDIRAALLFLLIGKCNEDRKAFLEVEGNEFFRGLLDDMDSRVAYYSSTFLLKRMMTEEPESYQRMLQVLIYKAQQSNNEKLLENPYLQMRGILQLSNDLGTQ